MPALVARIHVFLLHDPWEQDVDGRDRPGHDAYRSSSAKRGSADRRLRMAPAPPSPLAGEGGPAVAGPDEGCRHPDVIPGLAQREPGIHASRTDDGFRIGFAVRNDTLIPLIRPSGTFSQKGKRNSLPHCSLRSTNFTISQISGFQAKLQRSDPRYLLPPHH
jgi:hypothetical protein